jgi:hypothetical protein
MARFMESNPVSHLSVNARYGFKRTGVTAAAAPAGSVRLDIIAEFIMASLSPQCACVTSLQTIRRPRWHSDGAPTRALLRVGIIIPPFWQNEFDFYE